MQARQGAGSQSPETAAGGAPPPPLLTQGLVGVFADSAHLGLQKVPPPQPEGTACRSPVA